jgi:putative two-component system response regulator
MTITRTIFNPTVEIHNVKKPSILIVDDEVIVRDALEALLSRDYELTFAVHGVQGLALAIQTQPDLILLDVMMPNLDGFEVCSQIRATAGLAEVPILMITALSDRESRLEGLRAGVDDFLTKPFDGVELLTRINSITRLNRYRLVLNQRFELETMHEELVDSYQKTIEGWSKALDLRDHETEGHTQRVTQKSVDFARVIGLEDDLVEQVRLGAILHDIGKLGVPDSILLKPGKLTEDEWKVMRKHVTYAYEWLLPIKHLKGAIDIPHYHHEKWDGSGYLHGLHGEDIPLIARLFAIVDVYDALCSDRPYRKALTINEVRNYLKQESGSHFDPALVKIFLSIINE